MNLIPVMAVCLFATACKSTNKASADVKATPGGQWKFKCTIAGATRNGQKIDLSKNINFNLDLGRDPVRGGSKSASITFPPAVISSTQIITLDDQMESKGMLQYSSHWDQSTYKKWILLEKQMLNGQKGKIEIHITTGSGDNVTFSTCE